MTTSAADSLAGAAVGVAAAVLAGVLTCAIALLGYSVALWEAFCLAYVWNMLAVRTWPALPHVATGGIFALLILLLFVADKIRPQKSDDDDWKALWTTVIGRFPGRVLAASMALLFTSFLVSWGVR